MKLSHYKMLKLTQESRHSYILITIYCVLVDKRDILYHVFDQVSDILCGIIVANKLIIVPGNTYNVSTSYMSSYDYNTIKSGSKSYDYDTLNCGSKSYDYNTI